MANLQAAEKDALPRLIEWTDLKGSLHNHSELERRPQHAGGNRRTHMEELGLDYWAITDHSKSSFQANGLDAKRLREQIRGDQKAQSTDLRTKASDFRLLTGSRWTF